MENVKAIGGVAAEGTRSLSCSHMLLKKTRRFQAQQSNQSTAKPRTPFSFFSITNSNPDRMLPTTSKSQKTTNVTVQFTRLFFFFFLFLVPFSASVTTLFTEDILWAYSKDPQTGMIGMDFNFGLFWFSYRIDDVDYVNGTLPYSTSWTTQSYKDYCSTVPFGTQLSDGYLIDHKFFCGIRDAEHTIPIWTLIQVFSVLSVASGLFAFTVYIENFLLWMGWNLFFYLEGYSDRTVRRVRKAFKVAMLLSVLSHSIFQIAAITLIGNVVLQNIVQSPGSIQLFYAFFVGVGVIIFDLAFLCLYAMLDSLTFFHSPYPLSFDSIA